MMSPTRVPVTYTYRYDPVINGIEIKMEIKHAGTVGRGHACFTVEFLQDEVALRFLSRKLYSLFCRLMSTHPTDPRQLGEVVTVLLPNN